MARPTRIDFPGALFHVIARGNQRRRNFRDPADYAKYEALLERYQHQFGFSLYAYVLMPNHVHLLLETGKVPLARVMQGVQQSYTAYFNKRYRLSGHCFQGRYKGILCNQDAYLLTLVRYLHLNPLRAGLVRRLGEWRWSSHRAYLNVSRPGWVAVDPVLSQFARNRAQARIAYQRFMAEGVGEGHRTDLYEAIEQRYLGDEAFIAATERKAKIRPDRPRLRLTLEDCIRVTCEVMSVRPPALQTPYRGRNLTTVRTIVAYMGKELAGITYVETARALRRAPVTLSLQVQRLRKRLEANPALAHTVARVEERLRRNKGIKA